MYKKTTMIIPIKCFTCGEVISNKYLYYLEKVREIKLKNNTSMENINMDKVSYFTKENLEKTPESLVLDELKIAKLCCRTHFLTHVDIE
jgi:DNA-directed RNA polymerase I, II, and III subunit RPABC5